MKLKQLYPSKKTGYLPEVISTLSSIEDNFLHHENKELNHPADLFFFAFTDFIDSANKLMSRLDHETKYYKKHGNQSDEALDIRYDIFNLYFYGANFIDACKSIIKSLFENGGKDKLFTKLVREFDESIREYKEHTAKILNSIKHQHRRIRAFTYSWGDNFMIGYYIEGLVGNVAIGPDSSIHKIHSNMHTAFSLNWGIPFNISGVYFCAQYLNTLITSKLKLKPVDVIGYNDDDMVRFLTLASKLEKNLFNDEFEKKIANITKVKDLYKIEYPSKVKPANSYHFIANINLGTKIGIKNRTLCVPYAILK